MHRHYGQRLVDPLVLTKKTNLVPGMHVAVFGIGRTGHMVFYPASVVGESGAVYAVDILREHLEELQKRIDLENHNNIYPVWSDIERVGGASIPENTVDLVYIVNSLSQGHRHEDVLSEAHRLLKAKGRIAVVDWSKKGLTFGPPDHMHPRFEALSTWARSKGYAVQEDFPVGKFHRGIILFKHD